MLLITKGILRHRSHPIFNTLFLSIIFYVITRTFFFHTAPLYFDSFEYQRWLNQATITTWLPSLTQTHQPIHTTYLSLAFLLKLLLPQTLEHLTFPLITLATGLGCVLLWPQVLLALGFPRQAAYRTGLILTLLPGFILITTASLYEPMLLLSFLGTLWFWIQVLKRNTLLPLLFASITWAMGFGVFIGAIFLFPALFFLWLTLSRKWQPLLLLLLGTSIFLFSIEFFTLGHWPLIVEKYLGHSGDIPLVQDNLFLWIARVVRNILTSVSFHAGSTGFVLCTLSLWRWRGQPKAVRAMILGLLFSGILLTQYWHAGLYGRISAMLLFPLSASLGLIARRRLCVYALLLLLSLTPVHILVTLKQIVPAEKLVQSAQQLCPPTQCSIITVDSLDEWYEQAGYRTFAFKIGSAEIPAATEFLRQEHKAQRAVLIDSSAERFPYYQFDGSFWHIMSLGRNSSSATRALWEQWRMRRLHPATNIHWSVPVLEENHTTVVRTTYDTTYSFLKRHPIGRDPLLQALWLFRHRVPVNWQYEQPENSN